MSESAVLDDPAVATGGDPAAATGEAPAATSDEAETAAELGDNPGAAPGDD